MMKRLTRIKKISLIWSSSEKKLILLNSLYLKNLKNLRCLVLDGRDEGAFSSSFTSPNVERIYSKFFGFLRHIRLEKLEYKVNKNAPYQKILDFPRAPSSLETWSFSGSENCLEKLRDVANVNQLLNLKHLQKLKRLEMLAPLSLDLLNLVLGTIPQPQALKTLAFKVTNNETIIEDFLSRTRALLAKYQGLEHLAVSSESWSDLFLFNRNVSWKLKGLSIEIRAARREDLKSLRKFFGPQQATLESLILRLRFEEEPETFLEEMYDFIDEIDCLKKLKTLRIGFATKTKGRDDRWFFSQLNMGEKEINSLLILPLLVNVINELKDLKDLGLYYVGANFEKDFEGFFQALQRKSHNVETVEVNLAGYKIQKRDLEVLVKTLPQLKSLETLKIRNFVISDPDFFKYFAETIHRCSRLGCLVLADVKVDLPEYNPQEMLDMLKRLLQKKNLTHIEFRDGSGDYKGYDSCEKLRLNKLYEECPHIQTMIVPIQTYHFEFPSKWKGI